MNKYDYTNLTPFKWFILENFPFIEASFDALTNYQLFCKLGEEINKVIDKLNETGEEVEILSNSFIALQNYVNNYFSNLDVQDEINNKLDEMAQNGTLAEIIRNAKFVSSNLNFRNIMIKKMTTDVVYNGLSHNYPQGFCMINSELGCCAFVNANGSDDLARLLVFNVNTGEVIKEAYVESYHSNSLTFNPLENKIYIANCNNRGGNANNNISVIDYVTMTKESELTITNLPTGQRIRSFSYDRVNNKFYAGNLTTIYEIDLDTLTIVKTIDLDVVENSGYNQTIKVYNDKIIAFNMYSIVFYDIEGNVLQIQNIEHSYSKLNTGEPEDFDLTENQDLIFTSASRQSPRNSDVNLQIYRANIYKNTCNVINHNLTSNAGTTAITLYVNCQGTNEYEDGTSDYPYKSLQTALTVAREYSKNTIIRISGSSVDDYVYVNGIPFVAFSIDNDVTFGTLEVNSFSNLMIWSQSSNVITSMKRLIVTGMSKVEAYNIRTITNTDNNCLDVSLCSNVYLAGTTFDSNNAYNNVNVNGNSKIYFKNCVFNNYSSKYAIHIQDGSEVKLNANSFNVSSDENQHDFYLNGSTLITDFVYIAYYRIIMSNNSHTSAMILATIGGYAEIYWGDLCPVPNGAKQMMIKSKVPSVSGMAISNIYDINTNNIIQSAIIRDTAITMSYIEFKYENNRLKITGNRRCVIGNGTYTFEQLNANSTPTSDYGNIRSIYFIT